MVPARYQKPPQAPPSFCATPESLVADAEKLNEISQWENEHLLSSSIIAFYQNVSADKDLRDKSVEAEKLMDDFLIEAYAREDVYQLLDAAFLRGEELDSESLKLRENTRKSYAKSALAIPTGPKRDRFKEIDKRLKQISIDFQQVLNDENGGLWVTKEELAGVPKNVIDGLEEGNGEHKSKIKLPFKDPDLSSTLRFAMDSEFRRRLFIVNENKYNANVLHFKKAIVLRDKAVRLLTYPNHASLCIESKMAKTPKIVLDFLEDLRTQLTLIGAKEIEHLKEVKRLDLVSQGLEDSFDGNYYLSDFAFYNRFMVEIEYSVDGDKVAEYFPLQSTLKAMLGIFEKLFGLVFVQMRERSVTGFSKLAKALTLSGMMM